MDNKTHMMFHDQDIREKASEEAREKAQKETTNKLVAAFHYLSKAKAAGDSNEQIAIQLKDKCQLDDSTIKKLLS